MEPANTPIQCWRVPTGGTTTSALRPSEVDEWTDQAERASPCDPFFPVDLPSNGKDIQIGGPCQGRFCRRIEVLSSRRAFPIAEPQSSARLTASAVCPCLERATVAANHAGSNSRAPTACPALGASSTRQSGSRLSSRRTGATWRLAQLISSWDPRARLIPYFLHRITDLQFTRSGLLRRQPRPRLFLSLRLGTRPPADRPAEPHREADQGQADQLQGQAVAEDGPGDHHQKPSPGYAA